MAELRSMKRRAGIAEETLRIKKERLDEVEQEYEEEHRTFTVFSKGVLFCSDVCLARGAWAQSVTKTVCLYRVCASRIGCCFCSSRARVPDRRRCDA